MELDMVADARPFFITSNLSEDSDPISSLNRAVRKILSTWNAHHGFLIILPEKHFLYYCNLIHWMLGPVGKPIICTTDILGGRTEFPSPSLNDLPPGKYNDIALKASTVNAAQAAASPVSGTLVVVGPKLIPAPIAQLTRDEQNVPRIEAVKGASVGHIDFGVQLNKRAPKYTEIKPKLRLLDSDRVCVVDLSVIPKEEWKDAIPKLSSTVKGIIVIGQESIPLPLSFTAYLPKTIPTLLLSDEGIILFTEQKSIPIQDRTPYSAAAQFTWVISQMYIKKKGKKHAFKPSDSIADYMQSDQNMFVVQPTKKKV